MANNRPSPISKIPTKSLTPNHITRSTKIAKNATTQNETSHIAR